MIIIVTWLKYSIHNHLQQSMAQTMKKRIDQLKTFFVFKIILHHTSFTLQQSMAQTMKKRIDQLKAFFVFKIYIIYTTHH